MAGDEHFLGIKMVNTGQSDRVSLSDAVFHQSVKQLRIQYLHTENHSAEYCCSLVDCSTCHDWAGDICRLCLIALTVSLKSGVLEFPVLLMVHMSHTHGKTLVVIN